MGKTIHELLDEVTWETPRPKEPPKQPPIKEPPPPPDLTNHKKHAWLKSAMKKMTGPHSTTWWGKIIQPHIEERESIAHKGFVNGMHDATPIGTYNTNVYSIYDHYEVSIGYHPIEDEYKYSKKRESTILCWEHTGKYHHYGQPKKRLAIVRESKFDRQLSFRDESDLLNQFNKDLKKINLGMNFRMAWSLTKVFGLLAVLGGAVYGCVSDTMASDMQHPAPEPHEISINLE